MAWKDERKRSEKSISDLNSQIYNLESKLKDYLINSPSVTPNVSPNKSIQSQGEFQCKYNMTRESLISILNSGSESDALELKQQVQDLTKQLLKKQGQLAELQAEKSALKSRVQDLQSRYYQVFS